MERADVLVVGGGFAGLAAAAAAAAAGRRVTVLEARVGTDPRFRGELLHPRGAQVLASLGLRNALEEAGAQPVKGFAVCPSEAHSCLLLPYTHVASRASDEGLSMDHPLMVATLRREVGTRPGVELRTGARVAALRWEGDRVDGVTLADGRELSAKLTVIAEGRHSKLRSQMDAGESVRLVSFTVALRIDDAELPHAHHGHVFLGGRGPVLAYQVGPREVRMCVDIPAGAEKGRAALAALVREQYAPLVPRPLRDAMLRTLSRGELELCANHAVSTERCAVRGAVLLGDAAGCAHPLTAMGMTLGLHDCENLTKLLQEGEREEAALERYQRARYRFVRQRELLTDALYEVFLAQKPETRAMCDGIFSYWQRSPRGRAESMALLSGDESGLGSFAREYLAVVLRGVSSAATLGARESVGRAGTLRALAHLAGEKLEESVRLAWLTARQRGLAGPATGATHPSAPAGVAQPLSGLSH